MLDVLDDGTFVLKSEYLAVRNYYEQIKAKQALASRSLLDILKSSNLSSVHVDIKNSTEAYIFWWGLSNLNMVYYGIYANGSLLCCNIRCVSTNHPHHTVPLPFPCSPAIRQWLPLGFLAMHFF